MKGMFLLKDWTIYVGNTYGDIKILDTFQKKTATRNRRMFHCLCLHCGHEFDSSADDVLRKDSRKIRSCGCLQKEFASSLGKETGKTNIVAAYNNHYQKWKHCTCDGKGYPIPLYISYRNMLSRCYNSSDKYYDIYGGKGISVCEEWADWDNYYEWAMTSGYQDHYEAHRLNNEIGYCPENVIFLSDAQHNLITFYMKENNLKSMSKSEITLLLK